MTRRSRNAPPPLCSRCHVNFATCRRGLCNTCYWYKLKHGVDRPAYLWRDKCIVCGKPRQDDRRDGFARGRCATCNKYRYKFGRDRTQDAVKRQAPHGWCECGKPAVEVVTVTIGRTQEILPLCAECREMEYAQ